MIHKDYLRAVEQALKSFTKVVKEIEKIELMIENHSPVCNLDLLLLKAKAQPVKEALEALPQDLSHLLREKYLKGRSDKDIQGMMGLSDRAYYRKRNKALIHAAIFILGPFGVDTEN